MNFACIRAEVALILTFSPRRRNHLSLLWRPEVDGRVLALTKEPPLPALSFWGGLKLTAVLALMKEPPLSALSFWKRRTRSASEGAESVWGEDSPTRATA